MNLNFEIVNMMTDMNFWMKFCGVLLLAIMFAGAGTTLHPNRFCKFLSYAILPVGSLIMWWNISFIPEYQKQEVEWNATQAEKAKQKAVEDAPWIRESYETKIVTVDYRQMSIMFQAFDVVEFMDDKGYVYQRTHSMNEGPWRQIQLSFYHHLLQLKESGDKVVVIYDTKGKIDPLGKRVIQQIKTPEPELKPLWSSNGFQY